MSSDVFSATLQAAQLELRPDGEAWGALLISRNGKEPELYGQFLPQYPHFDPPGWQSIEALTGVSAEDVKNSWDDTDVHRNSAAERAFDLLKGFIGQEFLIRVLGGIDGVAAIEMTPMAIMDPTVHIEAEAAPEAPAIQYTELATMDKVIDDTHTTPNYIIIKSHIAPPASIQIPDLEFEPDPPDWFFIETLLGFASRKVAHAWKNVDGKRTNFLLDQAFIRLTTLFQGVQAPLTSDNEIDFIQFRRELIAKRFREEDRLPYIFVGRALRDMCRNTWSILKDTVGGHLFVYNVEAGVDSGVPALVCDVRGETKLEVLSSEDKIYGMVFRAINFVGASKSATNRHVPPPARVIKDMLTFADQSVPPIDTLVRIPTMRPDGTVHDTEGYDPRSRIWYAPSIELEPIPDKPTDAERHAALATVLAPFKDFPFVPNSGSQAGAIACLLDQLVRPMILGPRPLYVFDAPAHGGQGTGKTLLAKAIAAIVTGKPEITPWPDDPKEMPKLILSKLMKAVPFVLFDNIIGTVRAKDLAACATSEYWTGRLLHTNTSPRVAQTTTWVLTLNGASYNADIARRALTVRLDRKYRPKLEPDFEIDYLIPWVTQNRAKIIRACLILARAWVIAGRPRDPDPVHPSFEAWSHVTGGILAHAGLRGVATALQESKDRNSETVEHGAFVDRWYAHFGTGPATALQLALLAEQYQLYGTVLEKAASKNWRGRHMAALLLPLVGHVFGPWMIYRSEKRLNGHFVYSLNPYKEGSPANIQ